MNYAKNFLLSKTLWFNLVTGIFPIIINTATQQSIISAEHQAIILSVGNMILRFFTTKPII